jgi:hypothetical protein
MVMKTSNFNYLLLFSLHMISITDTHFLKLKATATKITNSGELRNLVDVLIIPPTQTKYKDEEQVHLLHTTSYLAALRAKRTLSVL